MNNFTLLCHSRPRLLKQALDSIGDTSQMHFSIRGDAPTPEVLRIAGEFMEDKVGTLVAVAESKGTGHARNMVIDSANMDRGDYLYLSDDDICALRPDWLAVLIRAYEEAWLHGFRVIGGYNHPYHLPIASMPCSDGSVVNEIYALALQSMLMKWEVWDKYGPFCRTPMGKVCQSEDADFCNKIRADGFRIGVVSPALLVNCGITNSFGEKIVGWEMVKKEAPEGIIAE